MQGGCKRNLSFAQSVLQYTQMNNRWVIDSSETVQQMVGQHTNLIGIYGNVFSKLENDYNLFKIELQNEMGGDISQYNKDIRRLMGRMGHPKGMTLYKGKNKLTLSTTDVISNKDFLKSYITRGEIDGYADKGVQDPIPKYGMAFFGKYMKKDDVLNEAKLDRLIDFIQQTFLPLSDNGYHLTKILHLLNNGDLINETLSEIKYSYKIDMASAIKEDDILDNSLSNVSDVKKYFASYLTTELSGKNIYPTSHQMETIISDLSGVGLYENSKMKGLINFSNGLRGLYTSLKYFAAPFTAPLMMAQAFAIGAFNLNVRARGLPMMYRGKAVDFFLSDMRILRGETPFDKTFHEELSDTWFGTFINKILPNPKLQAIVQGGWQTTFDMVTDNTVKRLAVATALSKEGWNFKNEEQLLKLVQEGNISKEAINRINANALLFYTDFRTNSSSLLLSRNAFSRWYAINALQGYVTNRSSEIFRSIYNFGQAVRRGDINSFGDFFRYIEDPANAEFRWLIYTPLLATKYSFYADKMLNDSDPTSNKVEKIKEYALGMNDFLSSFNATFIGKLFSNVLDYEGAYIDYVNSKGETGTIYGGIESGIYGLLGGIMSSLFKEMKALNIIANPAKMLVEGETDMSVIMDQAGIELKKIAEGMGRYNLLPGIEAYGLQKIPQTDDFFSTILMNIGETNESMKESSKLKKMEEIEKILKSPLAFSQLATYFNVVKWAMKDDVSTSELKYDRLMKASTDDEVMKNLYQGVFDRNIFNQMNSTDIYNMYKELVDLDMSKIALDSKGAQEVLGNAASANMKLNTFMQLLQDKLGIKNLNELIDQWEPSASNIGLQKMFALAENNIPGSSRAILAFAANRMQDKLVEQLNLQKGVNPKAAKNETTLTIEERAEIQKTVIGRVYPYLYIADKSSWYSLVAERAKQIDPSVFGTKTSDGVVVSKSLNSFVNSLGLMDMVAFSEAQKGNPNAKYISSVYSMIGKYVQDPAARLSIMNNTYETVERMNIDPKMKATIKLGNALGNIDVLDKALKDKVFMSKNGNVVDNAIRTVFGTMDHINKIGMQDLLEDFNDKNGVIAKASYQPNYNGNPYKQATSFGQSYPGSQYTNGNRQALDTVSKKVPSIFKSLPADYKSGQNMRFPYDVNAKYSQPKPIEYNQYVKISSDVSKTAQSAQLVSGYVRHSPSDYIDKLKSISKYKTPKWQTVKKYKVPKGKTLYRRAFLNYD